MPKVRALKEIRYGGTTYNAGEEFEITDGHVKVLTVIKKVELAPEKRGRLKTRALEVPTEEVQPQQPDVSLARGEYLRTDIRAKD